MMPLASAAGDPMVFVMPASPVLATTVIPCATASESNTEIGSVPLLPIGLPPKDCGQHVRRGRGVTAQSMPCRISLSRADATTPKTFITARLAPGATPRILMSQFFGSGRFGLTSLLRS